MNEGASSNTIFVEIDGKNFLSSDRPRAANFFSSPNLANGVLLEASSFAHSHLINIDLNTYDMSLPEPKEKLQKDKKNKIMVHYDSLCQHQRSASVGYADVLCCFFALFNIDPGPLKCNIKHVTSTIHRFYPGHMYL